LIEQAQVVFKGKQEAQKAMEELEIQRFCLVLG
jgi:hypothetical protein